MKRFVGRAIEAWSANPDLHILGNLQATRLSIVSFLVRFGDLFLHHNFVVALLNDLFGIQARGGCSCAGPYGHRLLGIGLDRSTRFQQAINSGCEGIKPGWVRVNFNYFCPDRIFEFIIEAVNLVASEGWKLLPYYEFFPEIGVWRHRDFRPDQGLELDQVRFVQGRMEYEAHHLTESVDALPGYLDEARRLFAEADREGVRPSSPPRLATDLERLRWFPLPGEVSS